MQPCLPVTGADPTPLFLVTAVLLLAGAVLAIVAIRRRGGRAAMLLLALPLLAGGSFLASAPSPAMAATCPAPTPTPTAICEPQQALADVTFGGSDWIPSDGGTAQQSVFSDADVAQYVTVWNAIDAIDEDFTVELGVYAQAGDTINGPIVLSSEDFGLDGTLVSIPTEVFDAATEGMDAGSVWVELVFTYDDGCGGTLTTIVTFAADIEAQVCVPAAPIDIVQIFPLSPLSESDGTTTATLSEDDATLFVSTFAAIASVDPDAVITLMIIGRGAGSQSSTFVDASQVIVSGQSVQFPTAWIDAVTRDGTTGADLNFEFVYDDGCGGSLEAFVNLRTAFPAPVE